MDIEIRGEILDDDWGEWYEWLGYSCTYPRKVINQLKLANGESITVKINSPGGDIFAASEIYTELRGYSGEVTINITGIAASAGSVIAMAGKSRMSPTAQIMVHNVSTGTYGDYRDMDHASEILKNANDTIANAYMCKTGMSREEALELMNNETYLSAQKAKELGLIDEIMFEDDNKVNLSALSNLKMNKLYNSMAYSPVDLIKNLKNRFNDESHPIQSQKNKDDFLLEQKAKSLINLMKIGGIQIMFKNREDYLNQRQALVNKAQQLHKEGKYEDSMAVGPEIENLDKSFDNFAKSQANLKALEDNKVPINLGNLSNDAVEGTLIDKLNNKGEGQEEGKEPTAYVNAWAKDMLGMQMTNQEKSAFNLVNQFTHTTANTGIVIPETVMTGIWKEIEEQYPLWNDVFKTYIKGKVTLLKSDSSTDAKWYDEATKVEDGKETFAEATLNGCELARCVTVSWKLKEMAIDEFIPFIQGQLSEKIGAALGYGVSHGRGTPGDSDGWKEEPMGIVTVLNKPENTSQVIEYEGTEPTYKQMTGAMAKVKGAYKNGAAIYANGTTIWNELANIVDATGKPYFVANPIAGGVGTILGKVVKEDDSMSDGEILIGNPNRGYHANINKQVLLDSEDHKKERETDYLAYGIVDGNVRTVKAFALLKKKSL